jgi:triacylglycerol lipase
MRAPKLVFALALGVAAAGAACGSGGGADRASSSSGLPYNTGGADAASGSGGATTHGPYPIVLAHGFFGFNDFAGSDFITYFYRVQDTLAAEGTVVYTPAVDPFNTSDVRGAELLAAIQQILADTGAAKVNIIGHSQGGLDARVVANLRPDLVASIVTISTPHEGTPVADVVLQLISDPNFQDVVDEIVDVVGAPLWDQLGNQSSVFLPLELFSQPGIAAFNAAHPDEPGVFYASIAGRSGDHDDDDPDCQPDALMSFIAQYHTDTDPVDPLLSVSELICANGFDDITNDGLVPASSARHGQFWGCVPADHLDEIGQLLGDDPGGDNPFDYMQLYRDVIGEIRNRGY